ncbi:MAG: NAD(P)-dependent alcohol dehydrogenase, partial [Bacteroidales bacterium]|nr:NAD(P)-dependent alcohol dehydrogenase [Bacteroidales bacterium]
MKAIVYTKYGTPDVLKLTEAEKPIPKDNEVLVKVHASTVTPMDWKFRSGKIFLARLMTGLFKPKNNILGVEFSGVIEEIGKNVTQFKVRDKVFGRAKKGGAHAEYICVPEKEIAVNPSNNSFEEAAGITFGATTALCNLRDSGNIKKGQKVLINGDSGGVGTFAVQFTKFYETEVTAVCSTSNHELVKGLGADKVIDY